MCLPFFRNVAPLHSYLHFYSNQNDAMSREKTYQTIFLVGSKDLEIVFEADSLVIAHRRSCLLGGICLSTSSQKKIPLEDMLSLEDIRTCYHEDQLPYHHRPFAVGVTGRPQWWGGTLPSGLHPSEKSSNKGKSQVKKYIFSKE